MASTHAKAVRRADVLQRLSALMGIEQASLTANAKGDPELALIITLERVADAIEAQQLPPVTVETVEEKPLETTETVHIVTVDLDAFSPATGVVGTAKEASKAK